MCQSRLPEVNLIINQSREKAFPICFDMDISHFRTQVRTKLGDHAILNQNVSRANPAFIDYICTGDQDTFHLYWSITFKFSLKINES